MSTELEECWTVHGMQTISSQQDLSKTCLDAMHAERHATSLESMASQHQEMPPAGYFTSAMRALLFGSYSKRSTTAVSPL